MRPSRAEGQRLGGLRGGKALVGGAGGVSVQVRAPRVLEELGCGGK